MSAKHLKREPHRVTNDFWWYEENRGISVCLYTHNKDGHKITAVRDIPWLAIRNALARKDRKG